MRGAGPAGERGVGLFGALVIIALAIFAGYYLYEQTFFEPAEPTCDNAFTACQRACRRSATDASSARECQEACRREQEKCESRRG